MQKSNILLDIVNDSKIVKQIAHEIKNSKGSPAEIMARIANDYNIELPKNLKYEIHIALDDVLFFIVPADLSGSISRLEESIVAAGGASVKLSSVGTVACVSTFLSASTLTCIFSSSTTGTISSVSTYAGRRRHK